MKKAWEVISLLVIFSLSSVLILTEASATNNADEIVNGMSKIKSTQIENSHTESLVQLDEELESEYDLAKDEELESGNDLAKDEELESGNDLAKDEELESGNDLAKDEELESGNDLAKDEELESENGLAKDEELESENDLAEDEELESENDLEEEKTSSSELEKELFNEEVLEAEEIVIDQAEFSPIVGVPAVKEEVEIEYENEEKINEMKKHEIPVREINNDVNKLVSSIHSGSQKSLEMKVLPQTSSNSDFSNQGFTLVFIAGLFVFLSKK